MVPIMLVVMRPSTHGSKKSVKATCLPAASIRSINSSILNPYLCVLLLPRQALPLQSVTTVGRISAGRPNPAGPPMVVTRTFTRRLFDAARDHLGKPQLDRPARDMSFAQVNTVIAADVTAHPTGEWVAQQARNQQPPEATPQTSRRLHHTRHQILRDGGHGMDHSR
jgi:hypothetical protein